MNVVEVKFDGFKVKEYFINDGYDVDVNDSVIVDTDRGLMFGYVVKVIDDYSDFSNLDLGSVVRISTRNDYYKNEGNLKAASQALKKCISMVKKDNLPMSIIDGSYNFDRSQLMFRFVADERIDFRNLARELGSIFKTRIELRQVGIRDKAKEIGGIGPCGRLLCCSSFLTGFDSITISMAKNQNVSLNPTKINGVCGRLLCCLKYENSNYLNKKNSKKDSTINFNN